MLPVVSTTVEDVSLVSVEELSIVVVGDDAEIDTEFCCEVGDVPEGVTEFVNDGFTDVRVEFVVLGRIGWRVSEDFLPLVGDLSRFTDETEDDVTD